MDTTLHSVEAVFKREMSAGSRVRVEPGYIQGENFHLSVSRNARSGDRPNPHFTDSSGEIFCALLGHVNNLNTIRNRYNLTGLDAAGTAVEMYRSTGLLHLREMDGVFMIIILDTSTRRCYIVQSSWGSALPLYYSCTDDALYLNTSLKRLLASIKVKRELDNNAVRDFLRYQYMIPCSRTLVRNVHKLVPSVYMDIDWGSGHHTIRTVNASPRRPSGSKNTAKNELIHSVERSIESLLGQCRAGSIAQTLTAGWDCNLILHFLHSKIPEKLAAVTIGGGGRLDETGHTRMIIEKNYPGLTHFTANVTVDHIDRLPEIAWLYEGYLFQEGMFLRYELARILEKTNRNHIFLGVGADQILFAETPFKRLLRNLKNRYDPEWGFRNTIRKYTNRPEYIIHLDYNFKMHETMLNSRGMQGVYPFVNGETAGYSRTLGIRLNWKKRYYRERLKSVLNPSVLNHIAKSGRVVDTESLFHARQQILMPILDSDFTSRFLTSAQIERLRSDPLKYHLFIIQLVYLFLCNELLISGEYDGYFRSSKPVKRLEDFLAAGRYIPTKL